MADGRDTGQLADFVNSGEYPDRRIMRRRWDLGPGNLAGLLVKKHQVGKRTANVNTKLHTHREDPPASKREEKYLEGNGEHDLSIC